MKMRKISVLAVFIGCFSLFFSMCFPMAVRAESLITIETNKKYEGMKRSFSKGYEPSIEKNTMNLVVPFVTKQELEAKVQEIRKYKAMAEEAAEIQKSLEAEIITYMVENEIDTEITDSAKITYKPQTRATLDKKRLEEDLGSLEEYTKVTKYNVLRIK